MKTQYREMFDEVHASQRLKEEVLNMTRQEKTRVVKKISLSFVVAAALAVILAGTALAAAIGVPQTLQEWFAQQWTEAGGGEEMPKEQAAVIDSLVQPVGATAIMNGISVTLDSITPGEGNICLMLKVKANGEEELVEGWSFMSVQITGRLLEKTESGEGGYIFNSYSWHEAGITEDGTHILLLFYDAPKGVDFLEGGEMELRLTDIDLRKEKPLGVLVESDLPGKWILPFTLEPMTDQPALTAKSARVPCTKYEWGENYSNETSSKVTIDIQEIRVTSIGYSYLLPKELLEFHEDCDYFRELPVLHLADGMTIEGCDSGHDSGDPKVKGFWNLPVDLSKVESVCFGDVVIPLEKPQK